MLIDTRYYRVLRIFRPIFAPHLSVSGIDAPELRHAVENPPPVARDVVHALRAEEKARLGFVLPVRRHRRSEPIHRLAGEGVLDDAACDACVHGCFLLLFLKCLPERPIYPSCA